jgi:hypothetical protein
VKTIIAGSRDIEDYGWVCAAVEESGFTVTEVVSGGAHGVDHQGERWGHYRDIPVKVFPADWKKYGKGAGPVRNRQMADYAEALIAVWDGASKGTENMIREAKARDLKVFVYRCPPHAKVHSQEKP